MRMRAVALERHGVLDFTRHGADRHLDAEATQPLHEFGIEVGDRHGREREPIGATVAGFDQEPMIGEVEHDIEGAAGIRHRRRGEPARRHQERRVPPMINERRDAMRTLPAICVHSCSVSQVSLHAA